MFFTIVAIVLFKKKYIKTSWLTTDNCFIVIKNVMLYTKIQNNLCMFIHIKWDELIVIWY